ncbi:MAG: DUF5688 family protein [Acetivibrio sp.]
MNNKEHLMKKSAVRRTGIETLDDLGNYDDVKENLIVRLNNYTNNKTGMQSAVYHVIGDMAMVLYVIVREEENRYITVKVETNLFERWKVSKEEVLQDALLNTNLIYEPRIFDMRSYIGENQEEGDFMTSCYDFILKRIEMGNVISNIEKYNGAIAFFYPGVRERIAEIIKDDYYLIFTSVHEAAIYLKSKTNAKYLKRKLQNINANNRGVEIVSNVVYYYSREKQSLIREKEVCNGGII